MRELRRPRRIGQPALPATCLVAAAPWMQVDKGDTCPQLRRPPCRRRELTNRIELKFVVIRGCAVPSALDPKPPCPARMAPRHYRHCRRSLRCIPRHLALSGLGTSFCCAQELLLSAAPRRHASDCHLCGRNDGIWFSSAWLAPGSGPLSFQPGR
jgi:hypothetical protein